jgi:hypothetical protein
LFALLALRQNDLEPQIAASSGFFEQGVFDEANRRRDDRAGYAAAGCVAKRRADVNPAARRTAKGGDQALQDSSDNTSAHGARYRFEEAAQDNMDASKNWPSYGVSDSIALKESETSRCAASLDFLMLLSV